MIDKILLTGAFEKMGPERVTQMLIAFGPKGLWHCYCRCALGFAAGFGEKTDEERWAAMKASGFEITASGGVSLRFLAHSLGITLEEASTIERIHAQGTVSNSEQAPREDALAFVALANEWLETRPASQPRSRETASAGACRFGRGE